jgi:Voltage gated chloride channel
MLLLMFLLICKRLSDNPCPLHFASFFFRWRISLLWRAFFTTAVVAVVLRALIDVCKSGKCGLFGKGGLIMFDVTSDNAAYQFSDLLPVIILGVIGGILGSFYNFLLAKLLWVYSLINEYFQLSPLCGISFLQHVHNLLWESKLNIFEEKMFVKTTEDSCLCTNTLSLMLSSPKKEVGAFITADVSGCA